MIELADISFRNSKHTHTQTMIFFNPSSYTDFDKAFAEFWLRSHEQTPSRNYKIKEVKNGLELEFNVAGYSASQIKVKRVGDVLSVQTDSLKEKVRVGRSYDLSNSKATSKYGLLTVFVPYKPEAASVEVPVEEV